MAHMFSPKNQILKFCVVLSLTVIMLIWYRRFNSNNSEQAFIDQQSSVESLKVLLNELDIKIRDHVPEKQIFGNIFSGKATQQIESYN